MAGAIGGPAFQADQRDVRAIKVRMKRASGIEQLLKELVVGRECQVDRRVELIGPEVQGISERLGGKRRGNAKRGRAPHEPRIPAARNVNRTPDSSKNSCPRRQRLT